MAVTNTFIDLGDITFSSAEYLSNQKGFTQKVNRSYDDRFAKTGAKIGNVTQARLPGAFSFNTDTSSTNIELQALNDASMPVTLNKNYQRSFAVDAVDLKLSTDDFMVRYMNPALQNLSAQIERDGLLAAKQYFQNSVGTAGTTPSSLTATQALFGAARRKLVENLAPVGDMLYMAAPPSLNELGYTYMTQLFNPAAQTSELQKMGVIANASDLKFFEDTLVPKYSAGTYTGTPLVNGASQSGATLVTDGWGGSSTLDVGATFTIAGVNAVNAETKDDLGYLMQFSVTAKNAAGAAQSLSISPAIVGPGNPRSNVSALPADNAAITVVGATATSYNMGLAFHKDALIFATADITPPGAGELAGGAGNGGASFFTASAPELGLSVYAALQYDIRSRQYLMRLDVLGGWAPLYPQLGVKVLY